MTQKPILTSKQKDVLKFIYQTTRSNQLPPTIREIAKKFGFSSTGTVRDYLRVLIRKGCIKVTARKSRAIELVKEVFLSIPVIGQVRAGMPALASEDIGEYLNLDHLIFSEEETFALRVKGDSMRDAGILADDLVVVKKRNMAQTGEIVVALLGDEATVKFLKRRGKDYYLEAANPSYQPIPVTDQVTILGKVINVVRRFS